MISFKAIQKANETIKTTNIKGKDYAEVNQRVKAYLDACDKSGVEGFITTEFVELSDEACTIKATAGYYDADGKAIIKATGMAREEKQASYINKTSYVENCETSAVGRCLGFVGLGIDTSICSAEELNNALDAQKEGEKKDKPEANEYKAVLKQIQAITGERLTTINSALYEKAGFTEKAPSVKEDFDKMRDVAKKYLEALKK